jgi:pimeloyl-ACP methyl ester carboxylesterase
MYMELFARTYPEEVAGLVLVEPRTADVTQLCDRTDPELLGCGARTPRWAWGLTPRANRAELRGLTATEEDIRRSPSLGDVPLVVLTGLRGKEDVKGNDLRQLVLTTHSSLAAESTCGEHVVSRESTHSLHSEHPALVVEAIRKVLSGECNGNVVTGD